MMAQFRKRDTGPELALREALSRQGVPFDTYLDLPGSPDIVLTKTKVVVFVHGCFWHGCPKHYRLPRSNRAYWIRKLARNQSRDRANARRLRNMGWHVATIWECSLARDPDAAVDRILRVGTRRSPA
jgi:DNA mismatch endonuclease (patch repair protein)